MNFLFLKKSLRYKYFKSIFKTGYLNFLLSNFRIIYIINKCFFVFFIKKIFKKKIKKYIYFEFLYNNFNNRLLFFKNKFFYNSKYEYNLFDFIFFLKKIGFKFIKKNIILFFKNKFINFYFLNIFFFNNIKLNIFFYIN